MKKISFILGALFYALTNQAQILNPDFELGSNGDWIEESYNWTFVICDTAGCGTGLGDAGAYSGSNWVWLCGLDPGPNDIIPEISTLSQSFIIPTGSSAEISLWVYLNELSSAFHLEDVTTFMLDGDTLAQISAHDSADFNQAYTQFDLDVSSYADGQLHELVIEGIQHTSTPWSFLLDLVTMTVDGQTIGILDEQEEFQVHTYPNPAVEYVTFELGQLEGKVLILISDVQGKLVEMKQVNASDVQELILDIRGYPSGSYLYSVESSSFKSSGNFIVQP